MFRTRRLPALFLAALLQLLGVALASAEVAIPPLTSPVTDLTGTLSAGQQENLRETLLNFQRGKGSQFVLLILPTTMPETIEQYSLRVVEEWQIGRKGVDDGALLLIAKDDRRMRIEVGYGLEGVLNDATAKRIIDEEIAPHFRAGRYFEGVSAGLQAMQKVAQGEPLPPPEWQSGGRQSPEGTSVLILFGLVPLLSAFRPRTVRRRLAVAGIGGVIAFILGAAFISFVAALGLAVVVFVLVLLGGMGGVSTVGGRRSPGGFRSYSGGGGRFGGGGASGSW